MWTNELGKGNSHTLNDIPFVLLGGQAGKGFLADDGSTAFRTGRSLKLEGKPHNRLLLSFAHAFGHRIDKFGNPDYCGGGALHLS